MSEWISVEDKLPDDEHLILFRLRSRPKTEIGIYLGGCETFETEYRFEFHHHDDVTHWMPLPEPPKGE